MLDLLSFFKKPDPADVEAKALMERVRTCTSCGEWFEHGSAEDNECPVCRGEEVRQGKRLAEHNVTLTR